MPKITPYTQTQAFQYQPLGLSALAAPMAAMQQSLDVTKEAIRDTDFDMDTLSEDKDAGKIRIQEYKDARDELLENLLKTNNYSDAAVKIKKLNKLYNKDPERTAYETNKAKYAEAKEVMKKKLEDERIEQYQYDLWDYRARVKYAEQGGASYDRATGDYNPIDVKPLGDNLEAEILKITADWGKMSEESIYESFVNKYGIENLDPTTIANLKRKYKGSDPELKQQLYDLLSSSDRFQNYWKEAAELDYFNTIRKSYGATPASEEGQENLNKFNEEQIQKRRKYYSDALENTKDKGQIKTIKKQQTELEKTIEEASKMGTLNELAESLYIQDYINDRQVGVSGGIGDLRSMEEITYDAFGTLDTDGTKKKKEKLQEIRDTKITTKVTPLQEEPSVTVPTMSGGYATTDIVQEMYPGGMSSRTMQANEAAREKMLEATNMKRISNFKNEDLEGGKLYSTIGENLADAEMSPLIAEMESDAPGSARAYTTDFTGALSGLVKVTDGVGTLLDQATTSSIQAKNLESQLEEARTLYNGASDDEKLKLKEEIKELNKEILAKYAVTSNMEQDIVELIQGAIDKGDKEIIDLFNANDKNHVKTARAWKDANKKKLEAFNQKLEDAKTAKTNIGNQNYWYVVTDDNGKDQVYYNNIDHTQEDRYTTEAHEAYESFSDAYFNSNPEGALFSGINGFDPKIALHGGTPGSPANRREGLNMSGYSKAIGMGKEYETFEDWAKDKYNPKATLRSIYEEEIENKYSSFDPIGAESFNDFYNEYYTPKAVMPTSVMLDDNVALVSPFIVTGAQGTAEGEGGILGNDPLTNDGVDVFMSDPTLGPTPRVTKQAMSNEIFGFDYQAYGKDNISYVGAISEVEYIEGLGTNATKTVDRNIDDLVYAASNNNTTDELIAKRIKERIGALRSPINLNGVTYTYEEITDAFDGSGTTQKHNTLKRDFINAYKASNPSTVYLGWKNISTKPDIEAGEYLQEAFEAVDENIAAKREMGKEDVDTYDAAVNNFAHVFLRSDFQNRYLKYLSKAQTLMNNLSSDSDFTDLTTESANYYQDSEISLPKDLTLSDGTALKAGQKVEGLKSYSLTYVMETGRHGEKYMAAKVIELFTPIVGGLVDRKSQFQVGAPQQFTLDSNISPEELFALEFQFGIGSQNEAAYAGKDRVVPPMFR
jgi:hypothetical protein